MNPLISSLRQLWKHNPLLVLFFALAASAAPRPIALTNITELPDGRFAFTSSGPSNQVFSLVMTGASGRWRTIDFTNATSGAARFEIVPEPSSARFYRIRATEPKAVATPTNYLGWSNSIVLRNATSEAIIVPDIGRIMQFRMLLLENGPFWENSVLAGRQPSANAWETTGSFGGDKAWPAPQSVWGWPPPRGFDSERYVGSIKNHSVLLTGPVDPTFGMIVNRSISLHPDEPLLRVSTTFEKVTGSNSMTGIWVVTQVKEAEQIVLPVPKSSIFAKGYLPLGPIPKNLRITNDLITLKRSTEASCKIGNDAGSILWVGTNCLLLVESPRLPQLPQDRYPDGGCSAEVYTNPNPTPYIELELLAPLTRLSQGQSAQSVSFYSLFLRQMADPVSEFRSLVPR